VSCVDIETDPCAPRSITHLCPAYRSLAGLSKLTNCLLVIPEVFLESDEDDGDSLAEMEDFADPLFFCCVSTGKVRWRVVRYVVGCLLTFSCTLSSESGESMAKQMSATFVSGYTSGRRRS